MQILKKTARVNPLTKIIHKLMESGEIVCGDNSANIKEIGPNDGPLCMICHKEEWEQTVIRAKEKLEKRMNNPENHESSGDR